jgi:integrase
MARRGDGIYRRGNTWWLDFTHRGERHVTRLGKNISRTVAGELARVQRAAILKGEAGIGGPKRADLTFDKAAEEFLAWSKANKRRRTQRTYGQCVARLTRAFTGKRLSEISAFDLERYKRERVDAGVTVMVNRELACLKTLYNRCREWGTYEGDNPAASVRQLREPPGRIRFLEAEEEGKLLAAAGEPLRTMVLVGIYTGIRVLSEALTLRWADVDLKRGLLTVQAAYAKSGKTRTVPLNRLLRAALQSHRESPAGAAEYVFSRLDGSPYRSIRTTFETACKRAGLKDVTPHVLRHTFASRLAMAGVDPRTIQELGGWASLAMVERYTHLSPTHKADAVKRIARNSPTVFATPARTKASVSGKLLKSKDAPVAQVDRAAVS